ncbi:sensor histidine kinase [Fulvivirga ligni]|uniref:sensor histidine kinase n=1 Tax=Fulvivirga ligni TaxID=2904246 RepID=UPI001F41A665|nr:PAS domain-containing sensor histidine kinase [Fulvivirga ligni]UII24191.1 PAS domain S-box protein [Fulvivirga ligni]
MIVEDERIHEEHSLLKMVADNTTNLIIFTDAAGYITWVNKTFEKVTEYRSAEVLGKKPGHFLQGPLTNPDTQDYIRNNLQRQVRFKADIVNYTKSGKDYWVELDIMPLKTVEKKLIGYMSVQSNVSNVKMMIGEMLSAKGILRTVLDTVPFHVSVKDPQGRFIFYNKAFSKDFRHNENGNDYAKGLNKQEKEVLKGRRLVFDQSMRINDQVRTFLTLKFPVENSGGQTYAVGRVSIDFTELKHARENLREREQLYFSTVKSINDAAITVGKDFKIIFLNNSAERLTGFNLKNARSKLIHDVFKVQSLDRNIAINPLQCMIQEHTDILNEELLMISKDGRKIPIEGSLTEMQDSNDDFAGIAIFFKDVSDRFERRKLERDMEVRRISAVIEGQESERDRISKELHDGLGQMLNLVKMRVYVNLEDKEPELTELMDEAIQEVRRMSENLMPAKLRDFDLPTALNSLVKQLKRIYDIDISFYSYLSEDLDDSRKINLYRIAQEAINNALKHAEANHISVSLIEDEDKIRLAIEDNGIGLNSEDNNNTSAKSTRHGLINMRERANIMDGYLIIESNPGLGTLIIVEIPKYDRK